MRIVRVIFEVRTNDEGEVSYKVLARDRHEWSGQCPPYSILHHSHSPEGAQQSAARAMRSAVAGKVEEITAATDFVEALIPLGSKGDDR